MAHKPKFKKKVFLTHPSKHSSHNLAFTDIHSTIGLCTGGSNIPIYKGCVTLSIDSVPTFKIYFHWDPFKWPIYQVFKQYTIYRFWGCRALTIPLLFEVLLMKEIMRHILAQFHARCASYGSFKVSNISFSGHWIHCISSLLTVKLALCQSPICHLKISEVCFPAGCSMYAFTCRFFPPVHSRSCCHD